MRQILAAPLCAIVAIACFCSAAVSHAQDKESFCAFEFTISGTVDEVNAFNASFTKTNWFRKSACEEVTLKSSASYPSLRGLAADGKSVRVYLCKEPHDQTVKEATDAYLDALAGKSSKPPPNAILDPKDPIMVASLNSSGELIAQASTQASLSMVALSCACGRSGRCADGYYRCSTTFPSCPPCP
jgi:hypothetical protein